MLLYRTAATLRDDSDCWIPTPKKKHFLSCIAARRGRRGVRREKPLSVQGGPVPSGGVPPQGTGTIQYCGRTTAGTVREAQRQYGGFCAAFNHLGTPYVRILVASIGMSDVWCLRKDGPIVSITENNRLRHVSVIFQPILRRTW